MNIDCILWKRLTVSFCVTYLWFKIYRTFLYNWVNQLMYVLTSLKKLRNIHLKKTSMISELLSKNSTANMSFYKISLTEFLVELMKMSLNAGDT